MGNRWETGVICDTGATTGVKQRETCVLTRSKCKSGVKRVKQVCIRCAPGVQQVSDGVTNGNMCETCVKHV